MAILSAPTVIAYTKRHARWLWPDGYLIARRPPQVNPCVGKTHN